MELTEFADDNDCRHYVYLVDTHHSGQRLDQYLAGCSFAGDVTHSRAMLQQLVREHHVLVDGEVRKNNYRLRVQERVEVNVPPPVPITLVPEFVEFGIVFEDSDIIVISKPAHLVVHPAAGNLTGTLVHGLLYHCADFTGINRSVRPGIVHRLDKDTSGLMLVAKNDAAQQSLVRQFQERTVKKNYLAIVEGVVPEESGTISTLIGRHPVDRKRMAVVRNSGKEAITHWRCIERFPSYSLLDVRLETGRTHQIRVHMAHLGFPIVGDGVYGLKKKLPIYHDMGIDRQLLHSALLSFFHPGDGRRMEFEAPLYDDMSRFLAHLRNENPSFC